MGRRPYGIEPEQQEAVTAARQLRADGASLRVIASALNVDHAGVGSWNPEKVRRLLIRAGDMTETEHEARRNAARKARDNALGE